MKNIYSILEQFGLSIPEDKKEEFDKLVLENYKTIADYNRLENKISNVEEERDTYKTKYDKDIKQRDTDLADLKKKLKDADPEKLETLTTELDNLKVKYGNDKKDWEDQLKKQKYEFAIKEKANGLKFTSNTAKKGFLADVMAAELKMEGDDLLGFDDYVAKYKEEDAGAFVKDPDPDTKPKPQFSGKQGNAGTEPEPKPEEHKPRPLIW
jgi:vacuolar-type H+-ATPase subunit I/STV1